MSLQQVCSVGTECYQAPDLSLTVVMVLGAIVYGGLVTTGMNCIRLLAPSPGSSVLQTQLLRLYVVALLVINTVFEVENFLSINFFTVFAPRAEWGQLVDTLELLRILSIVMTATLTDALLVWRCDLVQEKLVFGRSKVRRVFRLLTWCLWLTTLVLGVAGSIIMKMASTDQSLADLVEALLTTAMSTHVSLNLFATVFITRTVVVYQQVINDSLPTATTGRRYANLVIEMVLESSAMSLPLTIITIVGFTTKRTYGTILLSIVVPSQSFASVLLMYRIALGKAIGAKSNEEGVLNSA